MRFPGVATAKRTGERRLMERDDYLELDRAGEARWEFHPLATDPGTGEPVPEELKQFGFTPGGPTVIPGDAIEAEPGVFRRVGT